MTSDTERREVARRLRNNASQDMDWMVPWAVFNDAEQHASEAVVLRLADLIEPTRNCSEPTRNCGECDSDALLKLADDMEVDARNGRGGEFLRFYAGEIRRCCGVTGDE